MTPADLDRVLRLLRPLSVRWARRSVPEADAEDVAHAALEVLIRESATIHPDAASAWLRAAISFKALEVLRRQREVLLEELPDQMAAEQGPEDTLVRVQLTTVVQEALARVPSFRRSVVVKVIGEERPLAEVAREEGVPESTVRVRVEQGRDDLRAVLVRQRAAESRKTRGLTSWAAMLGLGDVRAWARRALVAFGATAAGGVLLTSLEGAEIEASAEEPPPAQRVEVAPLPWAATVPVAEPAVREVFVRREARANGAGLTHPSRTHHDVGARMLRERLERPE